MKRRGPIDWVEVGIGSVSIIVIAFLVFALFYDKCHVQPALKEDCTWRGGRVVDHHDGRGGWHCEGGDHDR